MTIIEHIVTNANWDAGRGGHAVTGIVLHTMVGTVASSQARFDDPASQVSVHYGIGLDGSITQWVDEANTAWQAGNYPVNQTTIGIEHEDDGNYNDAVRTTALYQSSAQLVADICQRYGLPADTGHIFLHKNVIDMSKYPGGTGCPDGLDTNKIISMAAAILGGGEEMYPNSGDVNNAYLKANGRTATDQEVAVYTSKPWNAPDGLLYGKVFVDLVSAEQATKPTNATVLAPGVYEVKG